MQLGQTLSVSTRKDWRKWLTKHHTTAPEIWLVYHKKHTGKPSVPYNEAVEEALCFGWIDSTVKTIDKDSYAQRFSPRRPGSAWSAMNKERVRRLIKEGRMTPAGLAALGQALKTSKRVKNVIPADILRSLKADRTVWENWRKFPASYRNIRIGWIEGARRRPAEFVKRLRYFLKMTKANKRFGMVQ